MTPAQARAARAILKLGVREVAERAKVTPNTVSRIEQDDRGTRGAQPSTVAAVRGVYEAGGIEFIAENGGGAGVRLSKREANAQATVSDRSEAQ